MFLMLKMERKNQQTWGESWGSEIGLKPAAHFAMDAMIHLINDDLPIKNLVIFHS
jgi:hypothetical protein